MSNQCRLKVAGGPGPHFHMGPFTTFLPSTASPSSSISSTTNLIALRFFIMHAGCRSVIINFYCAVDYWNPKTGKSIKKTNIIIVLRATFKGTQSAWYRLTVYIRRFRDLSYANYVKSISFTTHQRTAI